MNRLIDELATSALTRYDAETRFRALADRGSRRRGLALLDVSYPTNWRQSTPRMSPVFKYCS
jgi:hypothetical protein